MERISPDRHLNFGYGLDCWVSSPTSSKYPSQKRGTPMRGMDQLALVYEIMQITFGGLQVNMPKATTDNQGPIVSVVTWLLLVVTLITVITRTAMKWALARKTNFDDAVILAASAFAIGQSVAITAGTVPNGLGRHASQTTASQEILFQKSYYAAVLLYIPCICLSKLAVLFLLRNITPVATHRTIIVAVGVLTVLWAMAAELAMAFQCRLPSPWAIFDGHCMDITAFWYCFGVIQLLLDFALVTLPWLIVRRVRMSRHRKVVIVCSFGTRLTVVVGVVTQLVYFNNATRSDDIPLNLWSEIICCQVVESLSIITACMPYLKPFFDSLETGMIRNDDLRRRGLAYHDFYTPTRSRQSSAPQSWPADPAKDTIELNTHLDELPNQSYDTTSGVIPIGLRLPQQPGGSTQSRQHEAIARNIASMDGQPYSEDNQICQYEIWRQPSKARLLPSRG
ncbi:MAG: hypothetical protein Q9216_005404 [Gyalolechia sp. 2 TL-2023]